MWSKPAGNSFKVLETFYERERKLLIRMSSMTHKFFKSLQARVLSTSECLAKASSSYYTMYDTWSKPAGYSFTVLETFYERERKLLIRMSSTTQKFFSKVFKLGSLVQVNVLYPALGGLYLLANRKLPLLMPLNAASYSFLSCIFSWFNPL